MICPHAASGCNYPEGECDGLCMNKGENKVDEQDKAAFYDAWQGEHSGEEDAQRRAMFWFNKGLEYARGQQEQEHTQIWQAGANAALEVLRGQQQPTQWVFMNRETKQTYVIDARLADSFREMNPGYIDCGRMINVNPVQLAQPVQPAVNEQMLKALKVAQGILFEAGYDIDDGGEHFPEYAQITDAIAAAEAARGVCDGL